MLARLSNPTTIRSLLRAHALYVRTPRRLRRPAAALRLGLITACLWFASLFAVLGLGVADSLPHIVGFELAAAAGLGSAIGMAVRNVGLAVRLCVVMLAAGQISAFSLLL